MRGSYHAGSPVLVPESRLQRYGEENVPARVNVETGENHFSPDAVERMHQIIRERRVPVRMIETPVYEFA